MKLIAPFLLSLFSITLSAQTTYALSLDDVVAAAQSSSPAAKLAETRLSNRYWFYQSTLADFKPQIRFEGTLPLLNRSIEPITLPNGEQQFVSRSFMRNEIGFSISQDIPLTGGTVFASTGLERLDVFRQGNVDGKTSYLSTPFSIGFRQSLTGYNELRWTKELAPLRYQEAELEYREDREDLAYRAAQLFFGIFQAQLNLEAALIRQTNADTLFAISTGRYSVGRIAETELLQIELSALNANTEVEQARINLQGATEQLRNFLGITEAVVFDLVPPTELPAFSVNADTALAYASANRSEIIGYKRRLLEVEREAAAAKANTGITGDLFANFRLSQTADNLGDAYTNPLDNEVLTLGISIPIADWGKSKAQLEVARSNRELEQLNVAQERISLEQEILLAVNQFELLRNNVALAKRAYDVSEKALDITRKRYLIGKIGITELNLAIQEQNKARLLYIQALRSFWLAYYELRVNTLYDFRAGRGLR